MSAASITGAIATTITSTDSADMATAGGGRVATDHATQR